MDIFTVLLVQPLTNGLIVFYKVLFGNMGLAIIGFTVLLRIILNPLTKPYMQSMKKMREYAKEINKIKKRHANDKQKQATATADFYKQKGINPAAGCLPYLLQIVVLIALFNVFNRVLSGDGEVINNINTLLIEPLRFSGDAVLNTKFLFLDVTKPDIITIPGFPISLPGPVLFLAAFVQVLSAKIMTPYVEGEQKLAQKTPQGSDDFSAAFQKSSLITFPIFTLLIGMSFPSGLAIYWFLFSLFQVVSQYRSSGWGGLTPWIKKVKMLKS
ncbi:MAG: Stage III sporulation protein J [uncultured bacterium]|uniref:Membrane insertase YidC/Oxa/ALB C-terminal domain-containing protein n=1 Tax=Candidatus Woesebacteria bacterium RIFCSPHIGHO2_12_FULL_41_24 TaxID=1802510 RepID=A0A1F8AV62_9BACT|nr:MAG: Stage III sporulation protein J [uncultured bacterium]OGM14679.1 MAG: hypothetical protein A2W15_01805 [Candidatus Woesebacteria bacterium RBG_16_41_13]OGM29693.1 MAG: hypothetical protein A2873_02225 [Candidatus Woesebacteria bacterium RIFCSPHIGHO2_01_FULL_42_80]OGM35221.1 MAG: hypothetical protein A3D84_00305 [Candidatus Woesebacteria bacterium RIFCSPHIGHO2_02_FULL_42_20]OGM55115.1 MAG: hypothetical protein A3E44_04310 [Candidatus Woesebacteria bacterium RIFCSPHIGHO2_12_FULL_41_24]OG